jgi:hypothetical protein
MLKKRKRSKLPVSPAKESTDSLNGTLILVQRTSY